MTHQEDLEDHRERPQRRVLAHVLAQQLASGDAAIVVHAYVHRNTGAPVVELDDGDFGATDDLAGRSGEWRSARQEGLSDVTSQYEASPAARMAASRATSACTVCSRSSYSSCSDAKEEAPSVVDDEEDEDDDAEDDDEDEEDGAATGRGFLVCTTRSKSLVGIRILVICDPKTTTSPSGHSCLTMSTISA